jgi:hypothetical protein
MPWTEAERILGDGRSFYSDFCFIEDKLGRWHAIGIGGPNSDDSTMFHAVAPAIDGPYRHLPKIGAPMGPPPRHMWAPYAVWLDDDTALLWYFHNIPGDPEGTGFRVLQAEGPGLEEWTAFTHPSFIKENMVLQEPGNRDACIFWDDDVGKWLMYYAGGGGWEGEASPVIHVRTSDDLIRWSEPRACMGVPPGYRAAESPFVLKRDGLYYLWVSGFDYGRMSLYISEDPFHFGDEEANRIEEQSGHAPEIVTIDGVDWVGCAAIASQFGNEPAVHDLMGVFVQQLTWEEATPEEIAKIRRKD